MTATATSTDTGADDAIDFAAGAWSKGGHLNPPEAITDATARNLWRMVEGATRWMMAIFNPNAPDRDPMKVQPTSEDLVTTCARALVIYADRGGYVIDDAEETIELAQNIVDEAVRRLERDAMNGEGNGHDPEAGQAAGRFRFVSDGELETAGLPDFVVKDLLLSKSFALIVGDPGSMKSFLALDLAAAIQTGMLWAGRATRRGPVLYVLAEGRGLFKLRTRAWKIHHQVDGAIGLRFILTPVRLAEHADVSDLIAAVATWEEPPVAIFIDTLARCAVGVNENSAEEMGLVVAGVDRLREATGAAVILLHHTPRGEERERGSVALRAATDTLIHCGADGEVVTVTVKRQKDIDEGEPFTFRKRVIEVEPGRSSCVLVPVSDAEKKRQPRSVTELPASHRKVLEAIYAGGIRGAKQLAATAEVSDRHIYRVLKDLKGKTITLKGFNLTEAGAALINPNPDDFNGAGDD